MNVDKFTDDDFLAADISGENLMAEEEVAVTGPDAQCNLLFVVDVVEADENVDEPGESVPATEATTSSSVSGVASTSTAAPKPPSFGATLAAIGPVQFAPPRAKSGRGRKPQRSSILTSPEKRAEAQQRADNRAKRGGKRGGKVGPPAARAGRSADEDDDDDRDFCMLCADLLPKRMNRNNTIHCNTCDRPYHLKCVDMGGRSYYTCANCDSD